MNSKEQRRRLLTCLVGTWVVQRLKHIDLSAVPRWLVPNVSTSSRYQHSLSVGRLSLSVSIGNMRDMLLLTAASVLHDVGNGPFPHISDRMMEDLLGFRHEGAIRFAFENSPSKDASTLEECGLNLEEVASIVQGTHRLSPLLNNQPDLDNADNIYRFMTTIPGKPLGEPSYQPWEIAASISLDKRRTYVPDELRERWSGDREKVYRHLWDDELNMISWTMLGRAMRILKEELTPSFFNLTNREAFHLMRLKLPKLAKGLLKEKYRIILDRRYSSLNGEALKLSCPAKLRSLENELCRESGLQDWAAGITADQPLIREETGYWRIYLVSNDSDEKVRKIKKLLEDILSGSPPFTGQA